jgi:thioesterase domain-containing protein
MRQTFGQVMRLQVLHNLGSQRTQNIRNTFEAHLQAQKTYAPGTYSRTITFFAPQEEYTPDGPRPLWKNITSGGFELHLISGTHRTMSQSPNLQTLVRELENVIYEARQQTSKTAHKKEH